MQTPRMQEFMMEIDLCISVNNLYKSMYTSCVDYMCICSNSFLLACLIYYAVMYSSINLYSSFVNVLSVFF